MPEIEETQLPGVGLRHEFATADGDRVGVVTHRTGRRDLIVYDRDDPDTAARDVKLDDEESHVLAELLGGSRVTQNLTRMLQQSVEGLTINWIDVGDDWWCVGRTIADSMLRTRTGVSIVAVLRGATTLPSPTPDVRMDAGDTLVAVGTPEGLRAASAHLHRGGG